MEVKLEPMHSESQGKKEKNWSKQKIIPTEQGLHLQIFPWAQSLEKQNPTSQWFFLH